MNEAEWLTSADPTPMLKLLRGKASDRKLRLFAVACCRLHWDLMIDERSRLAIELGERVADRISLTDDLSLAYRQAWNVLPGLPGDNYLHVSAARAAGRTVQEDAYESGCYTKNEIVELQAELKEAEAPEDEELYWQGKSEGERMLVRLLLDIFGNPFRPVAIDPSWLTPKVAGLAQQIYDDRAFDRLTSLANALEEAGCVSPDILNHCRGPGPHVRGCWVVDAILKKE